MTLKSKMLYTLTIEHVGIQIRLHFNTNTDRITIGTAFRKSSDSGSGTNKYCKCGCGTEIPEKNTWVKGHNRCGYQVSLETREKLSESLTGYKHSEETCEKMSKANAGENNSNFGKICSEETCKKISESLTGYKHSEETCEKMSAGHQGIPYEEWTGWTDKNRPHLVPAKQCIQLNSEFEGSVRHHLMSGVILNIPEYLHRSVYHSMPNSKRKGRGMKKINKLSFQFLLGKYKEDIYD